MSLSANTSLFSQPCHTYSVSRVAGCTLIAGSIPIDDMVALTKRVDEDAIMSPRLAQLSKTTIAFGSKADVKALVAELTAREEQRLIGASDLARWLAIGERGSSSNAIVHKLRGVFTDSPKDYPHDPDDLSRCIKLLRDVPELVADFPKMAEVSPIWAALVQHWGSLVASFDAEAAGQDEGWSAPKTYKLMRQVIEGVGAAK
jgi:hypothetical protein